MAEQTKNRELREKTVIARKQHGAKGRTYKIIIASGANVSPRSHELVPVPTSLRGKTAFIIKYLMLDETQEPTKEEFAALLTALDAANDAARLALIQADRNLFNLRDARLEAETAHAIAAASNKMAADRAGVVL